jgi:hypothetical protein
MLRPLVLFLLIHAAATAVAAAEPSPVRLDVQVGFADAIRPGRWTPIFVAVSDPTATAAKPRAVQLELQAMQPQPGIMTSAGAITIGPRPATFTLYAPPRDEGGEELIVTLRDAATGHTLARWPTDAGKERRWSRPSVANRFIIGVLGQGAGPLESLAEVAGGNRLSFVTLKPNQIPEHAIGLDSLDLLIIPRLELSRLSQDRQLAILEWVRGGGCVLTWPGDERPTTELLATALPCRIGSPKSFSFSDQQRVSLGLAASASSVSGYELLPRTATTRSAAAPWATPIRLLPDAAGAGEMVAYTARIGFGRVTVSPIDPGELRFVSPESGRTFYQTLMQRLGLFEPAPAAGDESGYGTDALVRRQDRAAEALAGALNTPLPVSRWAWLASFAWMIAGIGLFIGPVDAFVLRHVGRRGLTPITIFGWAALLAGGFVVAMNHFTGQPPQISSIELIEQADDRVIGRSVFAGLASDHDVKVHLEQKGAAGEAPRSPAGMWELPASAEWNSRGPRFDTSFLQEIEGSSPATISLRAGVPQTVRGDLALSDNQPFVNAQLRFSAGLEGGGTLHGTIRNLSPFPMSDVRIRIRSRSTAPLSSPTATPPRERSDWVTLSELPVVVAKLAPGEVVSIKVPVSASASPGGAGGTSTSKTPPEAAIWAVATDLNARRSWRSAIEIEEPDTATLYARVEAPPTLLIREGGTDAKHQVILRVLTHLEAIPNVGTFDAVPAK